MRKNRHFPKMFSALFALVLVPHLVLGLPQGAPEKICQSMLPVHPGSLPQSNNSPFSISARRNQGAIYVTISSVLGNPFQGFMLQGRTPNGRALGIFENVGEFAHTINCAQNSDTATHNNPKPNKVLEFKWLPPTNYEGLVVFNGTIAQDYGTFWVGVESSPVQVSKLLVDDPAPNIPTRAFSSTPPSFEPPGQREASMDFDPFYTDCASTKLCFGTPDGCTKTKSCKAVVAVTVTGNTFDFEMKATQNANWVGVGLSEDEKMGEDSVIECAKTGNKLNAYLSWTAGSPNYGAPRIKNQLGIKMLNQSVIDDTIYCKVRRDAVTTINGKTFDLSKDKFNILIASGSRVGGQGVEYHDLAFLASAKKRSLADVSDVEGASKLFIHLHGAFMIAAWIGLVSIGTLLARYYRQTWTGSAMCGKDIWFAWHRLMMMLTWGLTIAGAVLIWLELKSWSAEHNPHAILGTITTVLCFFQPIGAFFRPHPGTSKRSIFNWLHWLAGNTAHIISIVTIFFAVRLSKAELPEFVDYILAAYVGFHVIVHLLLSIMGCVSEKSAEGRVSSFPMKDLGSGRNSNFIDRNIDAPYGGFRKVMLSLYIAIVILFVLVLIFITIFAPIDVFWKNFRNRNNT